MKNSTLDSNDSPPDANSGEAKSVRQLRVSDFEAAMAAKNRGEEYEPPEEDGVWHEMQTPDGTPVRMFVPRERSVDEQFEERVAYYMQHGYGRRLAQIEARADAAHDGSMSRIERAPMQPPQPPRTDAEAKAWAEYASFYDAANRTYSETEELDRRNAEFAAAFDAYNRERARTDANGEVVEGEVFEQRRADIQRENEALKEAALTLPSDPHREERVARYEAIKHANATYVATPMRESACDRAEVDVNRKRARAATAVIRRVMRSIWRTAPPPPRPPPAASRTHRATSECDVRSSQCDERTRHRRFNPWPMATSQSVRTPAAIGVEHGRAM